MTATTWLAFLLAAGVGAPARYLLDGLVQRRTGSTYPWGTFVVNLSGCFALGVITGLSRYHGLGSATRLVLGTGGLGAYTTFSTFSFETVRMAEQGDTRAALRYAASSIFMGLGAAGAGIALVAAW